MRVAAKQPCRSAALARAAGMVAAALGRASQALFGPPPRADRQRGWHSAVKWRGGTAKPGQLGAESRQPRKKAEKTRGRFGTLRREIVGISQT
jgi:hypothetical protein